MVHTSTHHYGQVSAQGKPNCTGLAALLASAAASCSDLRFLNLPAKLHLCLATGETIMPATHVQSQCSFKSHLGVLALAHPCGLLPTVCLA